jgi:two-component system, CitB family, sensor kinase
VVLPLRERIFGQGVSTRTGDNRGLGLALARQAARRLGGDVWLAHAGGQGGRTGQAGGPGAVFAARLPSVLTSIVEMQS